MAIRYGSSFDGTLPFSDTTVRFSMTANVAQTFTVPGDSTQKYVLTFGLSSNANLFVGYNVTATTPAANTSSSTQGIEFIPPDSQRFAIGGDVLSLTSPDATAYVGISIRSVAN